MVAPTLGRSLPWLEQSGVVARVVFGILVLVAVTAVGLPAVGLIGRALAVYWATVAVHEAGHAMVALAVGHRLVELRVGVGPALRLRLGGSRLVFGPVPGFGYVVSVSDDARGYRVERLLVGVAGLVMNALVLGWVIPKGVGAGLLLDVALFNGLALACDTWRRARSSRRSPIPRATTGGPSSRTFARATSTTSPGPT